MKKSHPYLPGILLFLIFLIAGLASYQDYGMAWDEGPQKYMGELNYKAAFKGDQTLFNIVTDLHGASFEVLLIFIEEKFGIKDSRDIFLMRHLVTHVFFLLAVLYGYFFFLRYFGSRLLASLGFLMLALSPRIYAHSFFNSKDMPFMAMTIIVMGLFYSAFRSRKPWQFALLGLACGYTTGIRILGIMFVSFILAFLLIDLIVAIVKKQQPLLTVANLLAFILPTIGSFILFWPFMWHTPWLHLTQCIQSMAHYAWDGEVFFSGHIIKGSHLPWSYFPTWFAISTPELWLLAGLAGTLLTAVLAFRRPLAFVSDVATRMRLFTLACFLAPIVAVIALHSVIYDDWRHLYFVYPPFVLMALEAVNRAAGTRAKFIVWGACAVQTAVLAVLMINNHPFNQVYFNALVSHKDEYLRKHYEMEYWGCGFMQGLEFLLKKHMNDDMEIKVCGNRSGRTPLEFNISMLQERDRHRIKIMPEAEATYKLTTFRLAQDEPPYPNVIHTIKRQNSTILCIYKMR